MINKYTVYCMMYSGILFLALYTIPSTLYTLHAQEATTPAKKATKTASPSASPAASPSSLQEKIEALKKEIASKAAALKQEVNQKLQNKAIAGTLVDKTDSELIILTKTGNKKITINEYTEYKNGLTPPKNSIFALKNIVKEDFVVALGDMDDKNILTAKRVIKLPKPKEINNKVTFGQIQTVSGGTINIKNKEGEKISVSTSGNTLFFLGEEEASLIDAKANKYLVSVGSTPEQGLTRSRYIYLIPSVGFFKPEKVKEATKAASN